MAWETVQWIQIVVPAISGAIGGIVTAIVQQKVVASNASKSVRRQKLEEIANLSVDAEKYAYAEQSLNTYQIQMIGFTRQIGGVPPEVKLPEWVRVSEEQPHKTPQLENLIRTFLPSQVATVSGIRRLEGELQMTFATILSEVNQAESSSIDVNDFGMRCYNETIMIIQKIKLEHNTLRKVASGEEKKYV
jgi:hypothetical protein